MDKSDILDNAMNAEEYSLGRLQFWLDYGKHAWTAGVGMFYFPYSLVVMALTCAMLIFLPYMIWHLYRAGWYKSVYTLLAIVVVPYIISFFIASLNHIVIFIFAFLPLIAFFFCTYIISYMIGERLNKIKTLKKWRRQENE